MRTSWPIISIVLLGFCACDRPCPDLASQLCSRPGTDERTCEAWKDRTARVPSSTCEMSLRALVRDRTR